MIFDDAQLYSCWLPDSSEKTKDLAQVIDEFDHMMLYQYAWHRFIQCYDDKVWINTYIQSFK